jgi:hypothetical protein
VIDPSNAYARLGVSPLLSTEEIRAFVSAKRGKLVSGRRGQAAQGFGAAEAEMTRLQEIEAEIGTPRARAAYDQAHPQNELLTVQPSADDQRFEPRRRAALSGAWLAEELGRGGVFPSAECLALWSPGDLDAELRAVLTRSERAPDGGAAVAEAPPPGGEAPTLSDLTAPRHPDR